MASVRAKVKAELLEWARVTAGFTVEDAAKKAAVDPARVAAWEDPHGEDRPTMNQLRMLAKLPPAAQHLYLSKPPRGVRSCTISGGSRRSCAGLLALAAP